MSRKSEMGKIKPAVLLILLLVIVSGCSGGFSNSVTLAREYNTPNSLSMSYMKFNGSKMGEYIHIPDDGTVEIRTAVVTEGGSLSIIVSRDNEKGEVVYRANDIQTSEFTITISGKGEYMIWFEAKDHKGAYSLQWH
ncbi:hypothetical protein [Youngiibacter multivorans]|uniref:DUF3244 domain-containing protein n=1 Tax=Youngiibacter multivorans TaxID=937251 RepID=A0ABS4G419_9CLOT|nr:hypothetical protein [Youngiibacter multivorans]MBP1919279.1 hypothetical protein [Youngiibacter multivorans]